MGIVIPAILESNIDEAEIKLEKVRDLVSWVQIDVIDGEFNPGKTFELELLTKTNVLYDKFLFDIHLMVKEPGNWINKCAFVNASRIIGHVEMMSDREKFIKEVKDLGVEAGVAFDAGTEINNIPEESDIVLLMGRKSGFDSRPLDDNLYQRIDKLTEIKNDGKHKFEIGVDGGVTLENISKLKEAGVSVFYCTQAIYNGNVTENLEKLNSYAK